uniref:helix-turn-helix domain-containing protein n=1 Tax=Scandinavium goeteborgense TaxID=1851514 RepID=UPI001358D565|nr:helix-turn-helix transcriptional regulator [Scandinavium goeteborgense]
MELNQFLSDWHKQDILAAVRKKKKSLAALSRENGFCAGTLSNALTKPWPRGEAIIASVIGLSPEEIWPSRYQSKIFRMRKRKCAGKDMSAAEEKINHQ